MSFEDIANVIVGRKDYKIYFCGMTKCETVS